MAMADSKKTAALKAIRDELLAGKELPLYAYRTENKFFPVVGEGSHDAAIMFIGEAPGLNEAKTARPFCGASGKFLTQMLESIGLAREDVYITNLVKDRPPENRDPSPEEIAVYASFLRRQIDIIRPKVIALLGRHSMDFVMRELGLESEIKPISKIHGKVFEGKAAYGPVSVVALYHPAVALYNGSMRPVLLEDFKALKRFL
jgi:uracil-DNA glycosylase